MPPSSPPSGAQEEEELGPSGIRMRTGFFLMRDRMLALPARGGWGGGLGVGVGTCVCVGGVGVGVLQRRGLMCDCGLCLWFVLLVGHKG